MKRSRGFTLIELMVVVSVVAILAAFAISAYSEQIRKAKRSEAMKSISQGQLLMEKYRANCPSYADDAAATGNCKDRNGDGDGADTADYQYPTFPATDNYTYALSSVTANGYVLTATKKATFKDPKCGNFVMTVSNSVSTKSVSSGDLKYCWP